MNCNNKLFISFTYICIFLLSLAAAEEATTTATKNDNDEEYYNLEAMTNEELEEICTSRGFELVHEQDDNGKEIVYTHQDYIDAATECLHIEEDLEEILEENPEILEDVSDRVKKERDRLATQLNDQQQQQEEEIPIKQVDNTTKAAPEETTNNDDIEETNKPTIPNHEKALNDAIISDKTTQTKSILNAYQNQNKLTFDIKEITIEVIQQIKTDAMKVINFIAPEGSYTRDVARQIQSDMIKMYNVVISKETREKLIPYIDQAKLSIRQTVIPSLKSFILVVKEWGLITFDMGCRYVKALMDTGDNRDEKKSAEDDEQLSNEEKTTATTTEA